MNYKVLLADDSLTIQKVIKITLANEPYEIIVCKNELELLENAASQNAAIVFLDFTLSESKSGYELAKELSGICQSKILMMYGTFDTIEEDQLAAANVSDKIVKPFDSTKFINICRSLVLDFENADDDLNPLNYSDDTEIQESVEEFEDNDYPDPIEPKTSSMFDDVEDEEWVVESDAAEDLFPEVIDGPESEDNQPTEQVSATQNRLESDLEDWGMSVPGVIGESDDHQELPPIIASESEDLLPPTQEKSPEEKILPEDSDLEYPNMDDFSPSSQLISTDELEDIPEPIETESIEEIEEEQASDNLLHLQNQIEEDEDELWSVDDSDDDFNDAQEQVSVQAPSDFPSDVTDDEQSLPPVMEEEISQPVRMEAVDDLPSMEASQIIDEPIEDIEPLISNESIPTMEVSQVEPKESTEQSTEQSTDQSAEELPQTQNTISTQDIDLDSIVAELEKRLTPKIEENIRKAISSQVEEISQKIAWDVIPDVAENLIREEIKKISDSVLQG